jgi:hypothetical protein
MFPAPDSLENISMLAQIYLLVNTQLTVDSMLRFDTVNLKGAAS